MHDFGSHASFRQSVTKFLAKNLPRDVQAARPDFRRKAIDAWMIDELYKLFCNFASLFRRLSDMLTGYLLISKQKSADKSQLTVEF